jgi:hypothetical protein
MKTRQSNKGKENVGAVRAFGTACLGSCQKVMKQIHDAKEAILAESRETLKVQEQILKLALNEAEALAWQTLYPHLLFPTLATEKVQAVVDWNRHQRAIR